DIEREPTLAQVLRIQNYPTVVLAAADGKILAVLEGYLEAGRMYDHLGRALASMKNPDWMLRDYQESAKAIAASDYAKAVALLKPVIQDGRDRPVQVKAKQLLKDLELQAEGRMTRAKQLSDKGQTAEAMDTLTELVRVFAGTQAAAEAGRMLTSLGQRPDVATQQRTRRARELLAQAREDYRTQQYLCCLDRCEILQQSYADLPEATEAMQMAGDIKSNPEWMQTACDNLNNRLGTMYLALAETWMKKGQTQQAVVCLEKVVRSLPGSRHAEAAQIRLAQLQGR